jgi:hypothetical protein
MWQVTGTDLSSSLKLNRRSPTNPSDAKPLVSYRPDIMSCTADPSVRCLDVARWPHTVQFIKGSTFAAVSSLGNHISSTGYFTTGKRHF